VKHKPSVLDLAEADLAAFAEGHGEKPYRARQVLVWLYLKGADDFQQMTDLPDSFRSALADAFQVHSLSLARKQRSRIDGSVKLGLATREGHLVEAVVMPQPKHVTVCVSSQVGCAFGCIFCASGAGGLTRNLTSGEIVDQVLWAAKHAPEGRKVTNVVFMGMGEPLANYENTLAAARTLNRLAGIGFRRMAISTCGLVPAMERLATEGLQIHLAVSLHAPDDATRKHFMPKSARWRVKEIVEAAKQYVEATGRKVSFEYVLIKGLNDSPQAAERLAGLLRGCRCMVNLIAFNENPFAKGLRAPSEADVRRFAGALSKRGVQTAVRRSYGQDISAACGQLAARGPAAWRT